MAILIYYFHACEASVTYRRSLDLELDSLRLIPLHGEVTQLNPQATIQETVESLH